MKSTIHVMRNLILVCLFSISYGCTHSQVKKAHNAFEVKNGWTDQQIKLIYDHTKEFANGTEVSFVLLVDGKRHFYGVSRKNDTLKTQENRKKIFEIGSITKVFTSTLLADLVVKNELSLEEPINNHLTVEFKDSTKISFIKLANHTSGLPRLPSNLNLFFVDQSNPYKNYKEPELKEYLSQNMELNDNEYSYSNLGAGLLGYVLTQRTSESYESLLQKRILKKYNMVNTTTDRSLVLDQLVKGRNEVGHEVSNWDLGVLVGAGGILSNVQDLSNFATAQFDSTHHALQLTQKITYSKNKMRLGLGWHIIRTKSTNDLHWHNGGTGGYTSSMALNINQKTGVIILSNVSAFSSKMGNIDKLCFKLIDTL
ncbi:MAG: serine hydrolase domain-containing protein [Bacteroidota bacterium]